MYHRGFVGACPFRAVRIVGILGEAGCIYLTEIGVLRVVGGGLADIVKARPNVLTGAIFGSSVTSDVIFRVRGRPGCCAVEDRGTLMVIVRN